MRVPILLILLFAAGLVPNGAAETSPLGLNEVLDDEDLDARFIQGRRERAATYRLDRERVYRHLTPEHHRLAAVEAERIGRLLEQGRIEPAREAALEALRRFPYSDSAALLQHHLVRTHLIVGDLRRARLRMIDLVERFTDYGDIDILCDEALIVARTVQATGPLLDLGVEDPRQAIQHDHVGNLARADVMLRYLVQIGDRFVIAPQATLQYARSLLVRSGRNRDRLIDARIAYEYLLDHYPDSPLVFDALCELALSHLLAYRGDQFDVGSLINARALVAQAQIYIGDSRKRAERIRHFADVILHWHQERDLAVARWYRSADQVVAARLYYAQARDHDPASPAGLAASRELDQLPPTPAP